MQTSSKLKLVSILLLTALAASACKDAAGPEADVASVSITGAPSGPILSLSTVQLVATPINSTGGAVSNLRVSWKSSDTTIATVSSQGLVTAIGAGSVAITGAVGQKEGSLALDVRAGGQLGPDGGTVSFLGGKATLTLPASALRQTTTFWLRPAVNAPESSLLIPGTAFEIGPEAVDLSRAGTLTIRYEASQISGSSASTLQLYTVNGGKWVQVRGSSADVTTRAVTGSFFRTGIYALASTPTDRITLTGPLVSGALYVGQSGQLTAVHLDALGDTLRGRTATWTTSNASIASVDLTGKVTAVSAGSAIITATSDGKSASTTLTILSRPISTWSQTEEWHTFQGNARHTAEIDATLDPGVFKELWSTTVASSTRLKPVTEGGGNVYVTAGKRLYAMDLRTGSEKWRYEFPSTYASVDPPAYGNGRVFLTTGGHGDSFLWAFNAVTGSVQFRSSYRNQWSSYFAPTVVGGTVYMAGGYYGGMYAFNATTGAELWFFNTNQYDQWTPAVSDGKVYAYTGSYSPRVDVVSASVGTSLYTVSDPKFEWMGWSMNIAPVLGGANNLVATQGGRLLSFDLVGRKIAWEQKASYAGNPSISDGVIYVVNNKQVEAHKESDGSLLWVWIPPDGTPQGTMVVTKNMLLVSTSANTYAVDLSRQRHTWSYPAGGSLAVSKDGILLIAQSNGRLSAISLK